MGNAAAVFKTILDGGEASVKHITDASTAVIKEASDMLKHAFTVTGDVTKAALKVAETLGLQVISMPVNLLNALMGYQQPALTG